MTKDVDYQIQLMPLGKGAREVVVLNEDDTYTIFIDTSLSAKGQQEAFIHAMKHILGNDFSSVFSADKLENISHFA